MNQILCKLTSAGSGSSGPVEPHIDRGGPSSGAERREVWDSRSVRRGANEKVEAGGFGERTEIAVSRPARNPVIDTASSNPRIAEARLAALRQQLRPSRARALPVARLDLDERQFREGLWNLGWKLWVTQPSR